MTDINRRRITKIIGLGAVYTAPLTTVIATIPKKSSAATLVDPSSPQAIALQYIESSPHADKACLLCALYQGASDTEFAPCPLYPGQKVKAIGWCSAYAPKG